MNADADMTASPVFSRWLEIVSADEEITVCPEDIHHEAVSNLYCFSPGKEEGPEINISAVQNFLRLVIENRRALLQKIKGPQMLFYCWHDAQARQLRFSMVSASHDRLPFGCLLRRTDELQEIVAEAVNDWLNPEYFKNPDTEPDEKAVSFVGARCARPRAHAMRPYESNGAQRAKRATTERQTTAHKASASERSVL